MVGMTNLSTTNHFQHFFIQHQLKEHTAPGSEQQSQIEPQQELSTEKKKQVKELAQRDREVRQHEQAHKAAAGSYATSGPHFEFQRGPDGRQYAIGGEVQIDTNPVPDDPQATIRKAQIIRRAALAPSEPSSQDRRVAAQASAMEKQARIELREKRREEAQTDESTQRSRISDLSATRSVDDGLIIDILV